MFDRKGSGMDTSSWMKCGFCGHSFTAPRSVRRTHDTEFNEMHIPQSYEYVLGHYLESGFDVFQKSTYIFRADHLPRSSDARPTTTDYCAYCEREIWDCIVVNGFRVPLDKIIREMYRPENTYFKYLYAYRIAHEMEAFSWGTLPFKLEPVLADFYKTYQVISWGVVLSVDEEDTMGKLLMVDVQHDFMDTSGSMEV